MGHDPATDPLSDEDLVCRAAAGDAGSFAALFRRRKRDVYRFALHMSGEPSVADDVTQEVFLAVMRDAKRYEPGRASVPAWLLGIARNHVRRRLDSERSLVSWPECDDGGPEPGGEDGRADVLSDLVRAERVEELRRAVASLPVPYREAVVLCDLHEMPYAEAAAALGCPVGTVRSRLHRARALLASKVRISAPGAREAGPALRKTEGAGQEVPARYVL